MPQQPSQSVSSSTESFRLSLPPHRTTFSNTVAQVVKQNACDRLGERQATCVCSCTPLYPPNLPAYLEHGRRPSKKGPNFGDSSGALFSMYSKTAETDDNTLAKRWQKDADGILIFVGHHVGYMPLRELTGSL
jgi:hypothetical protein